MSKRIEQVARGFEDLNPGLFRRHEFKTAEAEAITYSNYSYWRSTWKAFIKHKIAVFLLCLIAVLLLFTVIQPLLPDQKDPNYININAETGYQDLNVQPCKEYWFGTNSIGQDLWARIWAGTRTSLLIGILVGVINCVMGIIVGAIWGYVRKLDFIITEIYNIINKLVLEGKSVILISSNFEELLGMSDRILVMQEGTIVRRLERSAFSINAIIDALSAPAARKPI